MKYIVSNDGRAAIEGTEAVVSEQHTLNNDFMPTLMYESKVSINEPLSPSWTYCPRLYATLIAGSTRIQRLQRELKKEEARVKKTTKKATQAATAKVKPARRKTGSSLRKGSRPKSAGCRPRNAPKR